VSDHSSTVTAPTIGTKVSLDRLHMAVDHAAFALYHNRGGHMAGNRTVTDAEGRVWTCMPGGKSAQRQGQDVVLTCTTPEIPEPVTITVGWQWEKMSPKGLARLITAAAA
jgi:hypothetical protein